ncbi:MAG: asparagine synthase (glutamine-hydrolyzing) [Bacteroidetes bacterium]|nr:asparagine synthase (glutamine-hydrolyzing) [Bacteroidota bacterium]
MCGIFGFSLDRKLNDLDIKVGIDALKSLKHRGPDDSGYWVDYDNGIFLGHTRLRIIDLSKKNSQPMILNGDVLVYNGEIYNFLSLKQELKGMGERFFTSGDTEVVIKSLRIWGKSALEKFDGMFAFAYYHEGKIIFGTDPFGEKPLYIYETKEGIYFSSEIIAFTDNLNIEKELTQSDIELFVGLGFLPEDRTGFKNVKKLGPATYAEYNISTKHLNKEKYWEYDTYINKNDTKDIINVDDLKTIHNVLISSVESRIISDVPLGIFLSSGVDSLLIASVVKKELNKDILSLTVKFSNDEVIDESNDAKRAAEFLSLNHIILEQQENSLSIDDLDFLFSSYGELNDNLTVISANIISRAASEYIKVALTGTGGDELFYGYNKYKTLSKISQIKSTHDYFKGSSHWFHKVHRFIPNNKFTKTLFYKMLDPSLAYLYVKNSIGFNYLKELPALKDFIQSFSKYHDSDLLETGRMFDICHTLPNSYIPYMERGSMRASIEVRAPFLNKKLFELTKQYSSVAFCKNGQKWVLKSLLEKYLPKSIVYTSKRGFTNPRKSFIQNCFSPIEIANIVSRFQIPEFSKRKIKSSNVTDIILRYGLVSKFLDF